MLVAPLLAAAVRLCAKAYPFLRRSKQRRYHQFAGLNDSSKLLQDRPYVIMCHGKMEAVQMHEEVLNQARQAKAAVRALANCSADIRNAALCEMAAALLASAQEILIATDADLVAGKERGLSPALLERLALTPDRIASMADGLRQIAALPDIIGETLSEETRPNGLHIRRIRVPIGVIGIIYESRPNVTVDSAGLCLKSGNTVILRGG